MYFQPFLDVMAIKGARSVGFIHEDATFTQVWPPFIVECLMCVACAPRLSYITHHTQSLAEGSETQAFENGLAVVGTQAVPRVKEDTEEVREAIRGALSYMAARAPDLLIGKKLYNKQRPPTPSLPCLVV